MPERLGPHKHAPVGIIPIHFDVPEHYIPFDTFVETASRTRVVIESLNNQIFGGTLEYEFVVFPPEEGSFLAKLGVILLSGCTLAWGFAESDVGKAFIHGLTGHEPAYYAEQAGIRVRELFAEKAAMIETGSIDHDAFRNESLNRIVIDSTKSFLTADERALRRVGVTQQRFSDAFEARNEFYQALAGDPEVQGIGFDESPLFPIKRKDFALLQVAIDPNEAASLEQEWVVEILSLKVTSPNWDMNDEKRPWKAKDHLNHDRYFRIDDAQFWRSVHSKQLNPEIIDTIFVQLAYPKGQRRTGRVLRVLKFNDVSLGDALDDNALSALLGSYRKPHQGDDLFTLYRPPPIGH